MKRNQRLTEFRRNKGVTVQQFAELIGCSKAFYEKVEAGERNASFRFVSGFAQAFPRADLRSLFFTDEDDRKK